MRRNVAILVLLAAAVPSAANAVVIRAIDSNQPAGDDGFNLTRDLTNGLDFLDLTLNINTSFDEVAAQFGPSGMLAGYRHATNSEIMDLYASAGITAIDTGVFFESTSFAEVQLLLDSLGATGNSTTQTPFTAGVSGTPSSAGEHYVPLLQIRLDTPMNPHAQRNYFTIDTLADDAVVNTTGHWLVKPVPEPTAFWLSAAVMLCGCRWWRGSRRC